MSDFLENVVTVLVYVMVFLALAYLPVLLVGITGALLLIIYGWRSPVILPMLMLWTILCAIAAAVKYFLIWGYT